MSWTPPEYVQKYPHLFSPITIRGQLFKNRIISSPHRGGPDLTRADYRGYEIYSETGALYYGSIARGGASLVNTGQCGADPRYRLSTTFFNLFDASTLQTMHLVTDAIHVFGAKAGIDINHAGMYAPPTNGLDPIGPCDDFLQGTFHVQKMEKQGLTRGGGIPVRGMNESDMEQVADYFAAAAVMAKRGGFDVLVIHAGHGWLLGQYLSPVLNKRTDQYGGCVENRVRFPAMVLDRIRRAVGEDMVILLRYSANELVPGGISMEDAVKTIKLLEPKIDIVQCSVGIRSGYESLVITQPTHYVKPACNAYLARQMRKEVKIPVDTVGAINDPDLAESLLADGTCDFVSMARSFIADPDWVEKARSGHADDIRPCVRCLRCLNPDYTGDSRCTVNPQKTWFHMEHALVRPPVRSKKVAVIGGGPAGMQAALKAADRGHQVTIYEKAATLGGLLTYTDHVAFKEAMMRYKNYLIRQVEKQKGITVRLNTAATPELMRLEAPDAIIVAIGADFSVPPIPGVQSPHVMPAWDCYGQEDQLGNRVVILGGGFVGCETAIHLGMLGKQLTIVEMADEFMKEEKNNFEKWHTLHFLDHEFSFETSNLNQNAPAPNKIAKYLSTQCVEITQDGVHIVSQSGKATFLPADTILLATGMRPKAAERDSFLGLAYDVIPVGDCLKVGDVHTATFTGYGAAVQV